MSRSLPPVVEVVLGDQMPRRKPTLLGGNLVTFIIPALAFVGGMAVNAYTIATNIATKPYVDEGLAAQKKYTDEKAAQMLKDAFEHSDSNRQAMQLEIQKYTSEVKQDLATQTAKLGLMYETLKAIDERSRINNRR